MARGLVRLLLAAMLALVAVAPSAAAAPVPAERSLYADGPSGRFLLEGTWSTRADPGDRGFDQGWQRRGRRRGFRPVQIPHAIGAGELSSASFRSRVQWYRLRFNRPRVRAAGWRLRFESVGHRADVFLNGRLVGRHAGAHLPFELEAEGLAARDNELVVRVDGRRSAAPLHVEGRLAGWWDHGGILREVYLRRVHPLDLGDLAVTTGPGDPARVRVSATVRNASRKAVRPAARTVVTTPDGELHVLRWVAPARLRPGGRTRLSAGFSLARPRRWSPEDPALHRLEVSLAGGQRTSVAFGVRTWSRDASGRVLLNGRALSLRGASFHEQHPRRGGALLPDDREEIVAQLEALGADFARTHHPPHPALLEAFDRAGIVFWEQIPVWRLRGRHLASPRIRRAALADLRGAILRDRNHASVLAWSVANETLRPDAGEAGYLREAARVARRLDPTRLVAADANLADPADLPAHYSRLDAIGLNNYLGWYDETAPAELNARLAAARERFPRLGLFQTEFGAEANRAGPAGERGTYAFQSAFLDAHLRAIDSSPELSGALVWLLRDYAVRPGWRGGNPRPDPPWSRKGLLDERGVPKPAWDLVRERFAAVPPTRDP